ncbi:MAG: hypothetical protein ACFFCW_09775 [Candidatus Hodarchaeota archaeon]
MEIPKTFCRKSKYPKELNDDDPPKHPIERNLNVMIDPSLLVADRTMKRLFSEVKKLKSVADYEFFIPRSFETFVEQAEVPEKEALIRFFLHNAKPSHLGELKELLKEHLNLVRTFDPDESQKHRHSEVKEWLGDCLKWYFPFRDDPLISVLFEEWIFLQEQSWIVSRSKRAFDKFREVTKNYMRNSKKKGGDYFELGMKQFDEQVRKTLHEDPHVFINHAKRLKAICKWVAIGGTLGIWVDPTLGSVGATAGVGYMLLDHKE